MGVDADRVMKEEQQKIDEADELNEALIAEKEDLLNQVVYQFVSASLK